MINYKSSHQLNLERVVLLFSGWVKEDIRRAMWGLMPLEDLATSYKMMHASPRHLCNNV
jgi:hypothetical protein